MQENQPFACPNKALAFSLLLAGCALAPADQGGPAINRYTLGLVRNRRDCEGMNLDEAAQYLYAKRVPGHVSWLFVRDDIFHRAIEAWENRVKAFREEKNSGVPMVLPDIDPEVVMEVLCVRQNSVDAFNSLAFLNPNSQIVSTAKTSSRSEPMKDEHGQTMEGLEKTFITGNVKEWGLFNSNEFKRREGILPR